MSVAQQLRFHHGYIQGERDNQDIALPWRINWLQYASG
jgi:hypothetical protein